MNCLSGSEVDRGRRADHTFRVLDKTLVSQVIREFYRKTGLKPGEFDLFKVQSNGENLGKHPRRTVGELLREHEANPLVWVFSNHVHIDVEVNNVPDEFHIAEANGLLIKQTWCCSCILQSKPKSRTPF